MADETHSFAVICLIVRELFTVIDGQGNNTQFPVKIIDSVLPAVTKIMSGDGQYSIKLDSRSWDLRRIAGCLFRYQSRCEIVYSIGLNTCWRRFVIAKELAHLLIDTKPHHFTSDPVSLVQQLIIDCPISAATDDVASEHCATFAAIEIMIPSRHRTTIEAMARTETDLQIAHKFRVPEHIVNMMVRSKYGQVSRETNASILPATHS